ncbi:voltage-gated potassium channel [Aureococcus anophagefferens]|nr:voltage-gated potassium channel [Aureococcus anophagefferens]
MVEFAPPDAGSSSRESQQGHPEETTLMRRLSADGLDPTLMRRERTDSTGEVIPATVEKLRERALFEEQLERGGATEYDTCDDYDDDDAYDEDYDDDDDDDDGRAARGGTASMTHPWGEARNEVKVFEKPDAAAKQRLQRVAMSQLAALAPPDGVAPLAPPQNTVLAVGALNDILNPGMVRMCQIVIVALVGAHLFACFWYSLGTTYENEHYTFDDCHAYARHKQCTWIQMEGLSRGDGNFFLYMVSLYWALTTITTVGFGGTSCRHGRRDGLRCRHGHGRHLRQLALRPCAGCRAPPPPPDGDDDARLAAEAAYREERLVGRRTCRASSRRRAAARGNARSHRGVSGVADARRQVAARTPRASSQDAAKDGRGRRSELP